jgi:uncharacterized RDD family membrane protein YckC
MKELLLAWLSKPKDKPTVEEVEVQVWAFVVKSITIMVLGIAFGVLYAVALVPEDNALAPIDAVFLEILKAIAFMGVGTMGGISGRKGTNAIAKAIVGEKDDATN